MAALAFCIDTRQQRKLAGAKIVTIITNAQGESEIIPPCHKDMSTKHVGFPLDRQPEHADRSCRSRTIGVVENSRRKWRCILLPEKVGESPKT